MNTEPLRDLPRFFAPDAKENTLIELSDDEGKHTRVLRLQTNDQVHVLDGKGKLFDAEIIVKKRSTEVSVGSCIEHQISNPNTLILAVAPTKNINRFEWVIEKATEVGVKTIIPLRCENSERGHMKLGRLDRIMASAMKQSKALWATEIHELTPFSDLLTIETDEKYIAHCIDSIEKKPIQNLLAVKSSRLIAIGPEGDFSPVEVEQALENGFNSLSLGDKRLRTETAAIAACIASNVL
jgi:16S rRNA (uracil1498-N3)-methyltransferase